MASPKADIVPTSDIPVVVEFSERQKEYTLYVKLIACTAVCTALLIAGLYWTKVLKKFQTLLLLQLLLTVNGMPLQNQFLGRED